MARAGQRRRRLVMTLAACCGIAAGSAMPRAEGPAPVPARAADARTWSRLEEAASHAPATGKGRRAIAVAEVGFYPRNPAEAEALGGQALLLVTTLAGRIEDALVTHVSWRSQDGREVEVLRMTAQTNEADPEAHPAARLIGPYRHDALFLVPVSATETKAQLTASFAGREEVVLRFPRAAAASPVAPPPQKPGDRGARDRIAAAIYPFFRVPPIRSPGSEVTCPRREPAVWEAESMSRSAAEGANAKARLKSSGRGAAGTARATGSLDKEVIRGVIRGHIPEVQACYEQELATDPKLSAKVMVRFTIGGDGAVIASVLQTSDVDRPKLTSCIVEVARCWRYPAPQGGGIVIVSYPFVLMPAGGSP